MTQLGIGEAFVSALNEKGIPTPLAHTLMSPPQSRMDILTDGEMKTLISASKLYPKYKTPVDPESAYEILTAKIEQAQQQQAAEEQAVQQAKETTTTKTVKQGKSTLDKVLSNTVTRQIARTATSTIARGLLGVLNGMLKK